MTTRKTTEELEEEIVNLKNKLKFQKAKTQFYVAEASVYRFLAKHSDMNNFRNYNLSVANYHGNLGLMMGIIRNYDVESLETDFKNLNEDLESLSNDSDYIFICSKYTDNDKEFDEYLTQSELAELAEKEKEKSKATS